MGHRAVFLGSSIGNAAFLLLHSSALFRCCVRFIQKRQILYMHISYVILRILALQSPYLIIAVMYFFNKKIIILHAF